MKLISMTDYVLENDSVKFQSNTMKHIEALTKVLNYANFLKQPLKLSMFVPCDETGLFLNIRECNCSSCSGKKQDYIKSKGKVLFEGFNLIGNKHVENQKLGLIVGLGFRNGNYQTIEDLANSKHLYKNKITLTKSAIKQIGL